MTEDKIAEAIRSHYKWLKGYYVIWGTELRSERAISIPNY